MEYDDFDLTIENAGGEYRVTAEWRGTREQAPFVLPWDDDEARAADLRGLGRTPAASRSTLPLEKVPAQVAESIGKRLFGAVFTGSVKERYSMAYTLAEQGGRGVRIRLRTGADGRLMDIPWEYLWDDVHEEYLALAKTTQVVRYPVAPSAIAPVRLSVPLRVLVAISTAAPENTQPLEVEEEWRRLADEALGEARRNGLIFLHRVRGNLYDITKALEETDYHVFHYVGHSRFDDKTKEGMLVLEGDSGGAVTRSANDLAQMLKPHRSLQLAVFNSCEGARWSAADPYAGVAMSMVQKGIPAVIGMQFEITDVAAIAFAREFYSEIVAGNPVDLALLKARRSLFSSDSKDIEWGTPVLFLRSPDGRVFEPEELAPERRQQLRNLAQLYELGQASLEQGDWRAAAGHFQAIVNDDPDFADCPARLKEASAHLDGLPDEIEEQPAGQDRSSVAQADREKLVRTLVTVAIAVLAVLAIVALAIQVFSNS